MKFQSIYEPAVVLTSKFVNARVEAFYGVSKDTYHAIVEIDDLQ